ncbi:MAG: 4-(cytidine 5'-diphospho)-2-C-methyl-D-erythritol kinase [Candidatus Omnitrophica bacterium]|nr:4-(cytidine 5'-diphospho)-2-C-methyl-D-erythritol kinase [Candidatus Omnitrophota bacterium]
MFSSAAKTLKVSSPAKLNLFLDILSKRPDGYHDLVSLFERISLCDNIRLTKISSDEIVVAVHGELGLPTDSRNLAYQAADLIRRSQGIRSGLKIEIEKNIPVGAGLAGGSSNAASVLLGYAKLLGLKLSKKDLISYANRLGSDVAFFIFNQPFAVGTGRGGDLKSALIPKTTKLWHLLFSPPIKIMTKDVYGLLDREVKLHCRAGRTNVLTKKSHDVNILISNLRRNNSLLLNQNIYNRLSETVMKSYRLVSELRSDLLQSGLKYVHMSGSGPTLFTVFGSKKEAQGASDRLSSRFKDRCRIFLASTA